MYDEKADDAFERIGSILTVLHTHPATAHPAEPAQPSRVKAGNPASLAEMAEAKFQQWFQIKPIKS